MSSYDILVIFLSVSLLVSLVIWVCIGVIVLQIMKQVKKASETAQQAVENVEAFTEQLKNAGKTTAAGSVIAQVANMFKGGKK